MFTEFDRLAMTRALALAERGLDTTHPNPRVGCVIAKGERIIAEGWHERAGQAHAEVAALRSAKEPVAGATAYVTLEPCSHFGRTPPCVNALIEARIARVVFAVQDPNPSVSGQGADALLRAGIAVEAGLMEAEATALNIGFMKRMKHGLPWVRVKLAMSLDGRTALANGASQWITGESARNDVQRWRARCSAVMTGIGTVLADDPQLNVRTVGYKGRQPLRVVLDSRLRSPPGAKMFVGLGAAAGVPAAATGVVGSGVQGVGDVLIFAAAGGGVATASAASSADLTDPADLADDMAALVNAFETSPTAVAARSADVAGPASAKISSKADAPPRPGASGAALPGAAAKSAAAARAGSSPDDATWAGASLSGAVPVQTGQPKVPPVATGAPLTSPGSAAGTAVRDSAGQGGRASAPSGTSAMPSSTPAPGLAATVAPGPAAPVATPAAAVGAGAVPAANASTTAPATASGPAPANLASASAPSAPASAAASASGRPVAAPFAAPGAAPNNLAPASAAAPVAAPAAASSAAAAAAASTAAAASAGAASSAPATAPAAATVPAASIVGAGPERGATSASAAAPASATRATAPTTASGTAPAAPTKSSAKPDSPAAFQARRAALTARGVRIEEVPADEGFLDLFAVLQKLAELEVNEVLVEAGPTLAGQLLTTFFVDELLLYIAPKLLGPQGRPLVNLPELQSLQDAWGFGLFDAKRFGEDLRLRLRPK